MFNTKIGWVLNRVLGLLLAAQFLDRLADHASLGRLKDADDLGRRYLFQVILNDLTDDIAERSQVVIPAAAGFLSTNHSSCRRVCGGGR